jgi:hypothetical protein
LLHYQHPVAEPGLPLLERVVSDALRLVMVEYKIRVIETGCTVWAAVAIQTRRPAALCR